ncbi:MAG: ABC transporter substrate-binding protein [Gaiellaceae bacterium]
MKTRRKTTTVGVGALVVAIAVGVFLAAGTANAKQTALPRSQTLYMTGNQWSPYNDLNPIKNWDYATGVVGLVYETPFRYDPLKDKMIPWLATQGAWKTKNVFVMATRSGVKWSDGQPVTAADFKFSYDLIKIATHPQHTLWTTSGLKSTKVAGSTVTFAFRGTPNYQQWDNYLFNVPIVPQHVWKSYSAETVTSGNMADPKKLIGTGPFVYQSGLGDATQTFVWKKRSGWWATAALGLDIKPKYIVDIHNGSNPASLANLQAGNIDISNNFAPKSALSGKITTYFSGSPYHLGANTTWLFPNTQKKPLDDKEFRRALAYSVNMGQILDKAYQNLVNKANPTGLLPIWDKWIDKSVVKQYGFSYNAAKAKSILAAAGYKDTDGDGYVENKDGSKITLSIVCPNGWTDWMTAIQIISESAKAVGINVTPAYPEYATMADDRGHARYDLLLGNDRQMSNTAWTYYEYIFRLPILDNQTTVNYERYTNATAWNLTQQLDKTPTSNVKAQQAIHSKLQKIFLQDLPAIPLWYNGAWAMMSTKYWTNWPSSKGAGLQNMPITWRNYWQMTSIDMLTHLKPAGK